MPTIIDDAAIYSDRDLAALGIGYESQRDAIREKQLTPLRPGGRTYSGAAVKAFLGLSSASAARSAASPARAATATPEPHREKTKMELREELRSKMESERTHAFLARCEAAAVSATQTEVREMDAKTEFEQAVTDKMAERKMSRPAATAAVVKDDPELHRRYVEAVNANRPNRR